MVTKYYWKQLGFYQKIILKVLFINENLQDVLDNIKMI